MKALSVHLTVRPGLRTVRVCALVVAACVVGLAGLSVAATPGNSFTYEVSLETVMAHDDGTFL